jgi:hypothetical protein
MGEVDGLTSENPTLSGRQVRVLLILAAGRLAGQEAVGREDAVWLVNLEVKSGDRLELMPELGPPPFEPPLYRALGDLVEIGLVSQDVEGFRLTDQADKVVARLRGAFGEQVGALAEQARAALP